MSRVQWVESWEQVEPPGSGEDFNSAHVTCKQSCMTNKSSSTNDIDKEKYTALRNSREGGSYHFCTWNPTENLKVESGNKKMYMNVKNLKAALIWTHFSLEGIEKCEFEWSWSGNWSWIFKTRKKGIDKSGFQWSCSGKWSWIFKTKKKKKIYTERSVT